MQMNEITLWNGDKYPEADKEEAYKHLPELRRLICDKKYSDAADLLDKEFINNGGGFEGAYSGSFQTFGDLNIAFSGKLGRIKNFSRKLDIAEAVCSDEFMAGDVKISREYFSSAVDNAVFVKIESSRKAFLDFDITYSLDHIEKISASDNTLFFSGHADGNPSHIAFAGRLVVTAEGGNVEFKDSALRVKDADCVIICFTGATDYALNQKNNFKGRNPEIICDEIISAIDLKHYDEIKKTHRKKQ